MASYSANRPPRNNSKMWLAPYIFEFLDYIVLDKYLHGKKLSVLKLQPIYNFNTQIFRDTLSYSCLEMIRNLTSLTYLIWTELGYSIKMTVHRYYTTSYSQNPSLQIIPYSSVPSPAILMPKPVSRLYRLKGVLVSVTKGHFLRFLHLLRTFNAFFG